MCTEIKQFALFKCVLLVPFKLAVRRVGDATGRDGIPVDLNSVQRRPHDSMALLPDREWEDCQIQ